MIPTFSNRNHQGLGKFRAKRKWSGYWTKCLYYQVYNDKISPLCCQIFTSVMLRGAGWNMWGG